MAKTFTKMFSERYGVPRQVVVKAISSINDKSNSRSSDLGRGINELLKEIDLDRSVKDVLEKQYRRVESNYANVRFYTKEQILSKALALRGNPELDIHLVTALMNRANKIITGYELRPAQILSTLEFFRENGNKFCQVNTGEGKTTLTSLLAVVKSLRGETVDIITSNKVLAEDAVREREDFYSLFGLSVAHNNPDKRDEHDHKACYRHDIVYGTIGNFEFDYLKDRVGLSEIRAERKFGTLIIDEADNVVLDNATHVAKISGTIAGMEYLKYLYLNIWQKLVEIEKGLRLENTTIDKITEDNKELIQLGISASKVSIKNNSFIPKFLENYVNRKIDSWISNAIGARYDYHQNQHYIIRKKEEQQNDINTEENIIPLDIGVGVTLQNTIWTDLHPFMQIKHNLQVTPDSLSSIFISNSEYIRLYRSISGLTGTLGSEKEKEEIIRKVYNAKSTVIPTYKAGRMVYKTNKSVDDGNWTLKVTKDAIEHAIDQKRATLIICETVKDLKNFEKQLKQNPSAKVITSYEDESDAHKIESINKGGGIQPGTIVIATNIGGRGTDVKLSDIVKENGGLHVCTTFVASSSRILKQAAGRAARQGEPGSSKMIVKKSDLEKYGINFEGNFDNDYIYRLIDKSNDARIDRFIPQISRAEQNGQYFTEFADLYSRGKLLGMNYFLLEDLRLQWALAFDEKDDVKIRQVFDRLRGAAASIKYYEHQFFNPYFATKYVDSILATEEIDHKLYDRAGRILNQKCITDDPGLLASIKHFEIMISSWQRNRLEQLANGVINSGDNGNGYKEKAKRYLENAQKVLNKRIKSLESMIDSEDFHQILLSEKDLKNNGKNCMLKHMESQYAILQLQLHHVNGLIKFINNSKNADICITSKGHFSALKEEVSAKGLKIHDEELSQIRNLGEDAFYRLDELPIISVNSPTTRSAISQVAGFFANSALKFSFTKKLAPTSNDLTDTGIFDITKIILSQQEESNHLLDILSFGFASTTKSLKLLNKVGKYVSESISGQVSKSGLPESSTMEITDDVTVFAEKLRNIRPKGILKGVSDELALAGNAINRNDDINGIHHYFSKYTLDAINSILKLRIKDAGIANVQVVSNNYSFIDSSNNNMDKLLVELSTIDASIVLAPLNLFNKHASGLMFIKQESGTTLYYIDPENQQIPFGLAQIFRQYQLDTKQLTLETQKYANCGPEVIENFMLCLTGKRLSQEEAILHHSSLVERELLNSDIAENQYSNMIVNPVSKDLIPEDIGIMELICGSSYYTDNMGYVEPELPESDLLVDFTTDSIV
ncbi:SecA-like domain protein (plasmid) [Candidatus Megaera polyxenophila]|nr:SecA-like domain protein [Candidatus Megaera polyxenophila]